MNFKEEVLKMLGEEYIDEGAYSNGRYEHREGKKINRYNPGHASPLFTAPNGARAKSLPDDGFNGAFDNPMNHKYSNYQFGRDGTGTNYRKGEIPNGYMVWSKEDEFELNKRWNNLLDKIRNASAPNTKYKDFPAEAIYLKMGTKYALPDGRSPLFNKVQTAIIQKALDSYNELYIKRKRIERNNQKYDDSRSDRQVKKDARLFKKDKERYDYKYNGGDKPVQTQSKAFRKEVNSGMKQDAVRRERNKRRVEIADKKKHYIDDMREKNRKSIWSSEARQRRQERIERNEY